MQRFEFPLEKALAWRAATLKKEEAKLARMHQEREERLRRRAALEEAALQTAEGISGSSRVGGLELALLAEYGRSTKSRQKKLTAEIRECDSRIDQQTRLVMEANRQKQLLEDLREEQLNQWNQEYHREVEATAGELYLARWKRPV